MFQTLTHLDSVHSDFFYSISYSFTAWKVSINSFNPEVNNLSNQRVLAYRIFNWSTLNRMNISLDNSLIIVALFLKYIWLPMYVMTYCYLTYFNLCRYIFLFQRFSSQCLIQYKFKFSKWSYIELMCLKNIIKS